MPGTKFVEKCGRILLFIIEKGPASKKQIERGVRPRIDKPTIYAAIAYLLSEGHINVKRTESFRVVTQVNYFDLSLLGLMDVISALGNNEKGHRRLDYLAKKYREVMPSVFDAWPAILEAKIGDLAFERLQLVCSMPRFRREQITKDSKDLSKDAIVFFFDPVGGGATRDGDQRWLQGIQGSRILRDGAKRALRDRIAWYNYQIAEFTDMARDDNARLEDLSAQDDSD